ncbi:hypothetical protein [Rhizorhabdus dicambivorans]|uniref:hypothetical protein n=1 Tax=Rhizorhabdus dicambivorans TaxID=1850238 RepID=UPI000832F2DA|nr:hypothetical protein [Rhizorhabdus dicambivorans]ATE66284.1 hypothetical protein CMV14_19345 [Rhizorhabdus dicambivorans]
MPSLIALTTVRLNGNIAQLTRPFRSAYALGSTHRMALVKKTALGSPTRTRTIEPAAAKPVPKRKVPVMRTSKGKTGTTADRINQATLELASGLSQALDELMIRNDRVRWSARSFDRLRHRSKARSNAGLPDF